MEHRNIIEVALKADIQAVIENKDKLFYALDDGKYYTVIESIEDANPVYYVKEAPLTVAMEDPAVIRKVDENFTTVDDIIRNRKSIKHINSKSNIYLVESCVGQMFYAEDEDKYYEVIVEDDSVTPIVYGWKEIETGGGGIKSFSLNNEEIEPDENDNINIDIEGIELIGLNNNMIVYGIKKPIRRWPGLKFTALGDTVIYLTLSNWSEEFFNRLDMYKSSDGINWEAWSAGDDGIILNQGDSIYLWNKNNVLSYNENQYFYFEIQGGGDVQASGDITSLINFDALTPYCFYNLFENCSHLLTAPDLPATTLAEHCYNNMFYGCTALTTAPDLPATTLVYYCYFGMFQNCSNLNSVKIYFTGTFTEDIFGDWLSGVSQTGTLYYNGSDSAPIPSGWTVQTFA